MANDEANMVGRKFKADPPLIVTAERIAAFCDAVGDNNPLYLDPDAARQGPYGRIIAPPALVASFRHADNVFDRMALFRNGGLMAGIDVEIDLPVFAGDAIQIASEVKETYQKTGRTGTMVFVVVRSTLTNQHGDVVARVDFRMMKRQPAER